MTSYDVTSTINQSLLHGGYGDRSGLQRGHAYGGRRGAVCHEPLHQLFRRRFARARGA
jgi:hypothetical protein